MHGRVCTSKCDRESETKFARLRREVRDEREREKKKREKEGERRRRRRKRCGAMKAQGETRCVLSKWRDAKFDFENESRCDIIVSKVRDSSVFQSGHLRVETVKFLFVSGIILYRRTLDFSTKFVYDRGVQIYGTAS